MTTPSVPAQKIINKAKEQKQGVEMIHFPLDLGKIFMSFQFYDYRKLGATPAVASNDGLVRGFSSADKVNVQKAIENTKERFAEIHLPLSQNLVDTFQVAWNQTELGLTATLLSEGLQGFNDARNYLASKQLNEDTARVSDSQLGNGGEVSRELKTVNDWVGAGVSTTAGASALAIAKMGMSQTTSGLIELSTGIQTNPNLAMLFQGPTLKSHQFSWKLAPRTLGETVSARRILGIFKRAMHPERLNASTTGFLKYPSECLIQFHGPRDHFLYAIRPVIVEDVTINYAPAGIPSFFDGTYEPTIIDLTIRVRETSYYLRDSFDNEDEYGADGLQTNDLISNPPTDDDPGDVSD